MSRKEVIQCDVCKKEHDAQYVLPPEWITLQRHDLHGDINELHACSEQCLFDWIVNHWPVVGKPAQQEPQEQPACKARRFLLIDESANICEGVRWGDGSVTLDGNTPYSSWEVLKMAHDGSGVQWIDQEVSE